jgi:glutamine synthetase
MGDRRHLEYRSADNAANPFSLLIAVLAAGLDGIISQAALPSPATDDVGHLSSHEAQARGLEFLPRSLPEALSALESDEIIGQALGPVILGEFLKVKRTELSAYDVHVHPWERGMYLETI